MAEEESARGEQSWMTDQDLVSCNFRRRVEAISPAIPSDHVLLFLSQATLGAFFMYQ